MTVFIRNKDTGKVVRYPLIGNVGFDDTYIVIAKDPRISATVYKIPLYEYELIRVTEEDLETPELVQDNEHLYTTADRYIETVFGRETR